MDLMTLIFGLHVLTNSFKENETDYGYEDDCDDDFEEYEQTDDY